MENLAYLNHLLIEVVSLNKIIPLQYAWVILLFLVIFMTLIANFVMKIAIKRLLKQLDKTKTLWDEAVLNVIRKPLRYFIDFSGLLWALQILSQYEEKNWNDSIALAWRIGIIIAVAWFFLRLIRALEESFTTNAPQKYNADETTILAVGRLLRLSIVITTSLIIMQNFGISVSGVLAFGGIGGIAVGFAARDLLANFFGAFMVFIDKPFRVGDWIRSPDRKIEGTVEYIGWRVTRIRTFDQRPLYVPNSTFVNIAVENPSRMRNRRIYETIGLRYEDVDKLEAIIADIKTMLQNHEDIDPNRTLIVAFNQYGAYSVDFMVYTFTNTIAWVKYHDIKQKILLQIKDIVHAHGADFAFPTQQLYVKQQMPVEGNSNQAITDYSLSPEEKDIFF